ncbi:MAG: 30S ribosomal protein S4 [Methanobacteriota archaeon]|nr:MAG: 30S ribosomal protein S4 [Euryarchaeota archaeon]
MGDPKFSRRRYETPAQPWEGERIKAENELLQKYGLKNKRELWTAQSMVRRLRAQSRELQARLRTGDPQADKETKELLRRCGRLALLPSEGATLNDVLALNTETILDRRLQTVVYRKGLAFTPRQARQMIVHGHASVDGRKVTIPGYLVKRGEEELIQYHVSSPLTDDMHPARPKQEDLDRQRMVEAAEKEREKEERSRPGQRGGRKPERRPGRTEASPKKDAPKAKPQEGKETEG